MVHSTHCIALLVCFWQNIIVAKSQAVGISAPALIMTKNQAVVHETRRARFDDIQTVLRKLSMSSPVVSNLLEESALLTGTEGDAMTPGVNATLEQLHQTIIDKILLAIKTHHDSTQTAVDTKVATLAASTASAVEHRDNATHVDTAYVQCIRNLDSCHKNHFACKKKEALHDKGTEEPCEAMKGEQFYTTKTSVELARFPHITCDFAKSATECKFEEWSSDLQNWANQRIHPELVAKRERYDSYKKECDRQRRRYQDQVESCKALRAQCLEQQIECDHLKIKRDVSICTFGDRLQEKCQVKTELDDLVSEIAGSGSAYSDGDRREEWSSAKLIMCMIQKHRLGAEFDEATMEQCHVAGTNYDDNVGRLDLATRKVKALNQGHNFACNETMISFSGVKVTKTSPSWSSYPVYTFDSPHAEDVMLTFGTEPFDVCSAGQSA
jgi:hypothetical protein|eukprot:TRINITY_DN6624_c0_g1_i1.p1 TRINITY_DN6624_c0_g1~~TRINITY_DN6624_c0_g1_i1.p1  ORF type:complete len:466 (+),score=48.88 TRINITY_DN6624_c0_g1_i1:79-1398(+)